MSTILFHTPFTSGNVEEGQRIIRNVCVITGDREATGHDLQIDDRTLGQMLECAQRRGQVPTKIDHKSGVASICGFITNFRIQGKKLLGDWTLMESHEETPRLLERAKIMPGTFGLSASFVGGGEFLGNGKKAARCHSIKSIDVVTDPATNDGLFSVPEPSASRDHAGGMFVMLERVGIDLEFFSLRPALTDRERASDGTFVDQAGGAPVDPNTMHAAYSGVHAERRARQAAILKAWRRKKVVKPVQDELAQAGEATAFATREDQKKREGLPPAISAGISGAASGAVIGGISLLRRGTTLAQGLRTIGTATAAGATLAGGGTAVGSAIIGEPKDDEEGAPFAKRTAIGGSILGAAAGGVGVLAARKIPWVQRKMANLAKEWRPVNAVQNASLPAAVAGGTAVGAAAGAAQGADEGSQVDTLANLRRERQDKQKRGSARQTLLAARQHLRTL